MKKTNTVILTALLAATVVFFLSELIGRWIGGDTGIAVVVIPYSIAYSVGLVLAVVGIPVSLFGIFRFRGDGRASVVISGLTCLASVAFIIFMWVVPIVTGFRARDAAEKKHTNEKIAEQSDAANRCPR